VPSRRKRSRNLGVSGILRLLAEEGELAEEEGELAEEGERAEEEGERAEVKRQPLVILLSEPVSLIFGSPSL
jgi:hypothetical protein